jgi:hypothetical protein
VRHTAIVLLLVVALAACGSTSKKAQAQPLINDACLKFAATALAVDPNSGVPKMTISSARSTIAQAASRAQAAALLDPKWAPAAKALAAMAGALATESNAGMLSAVPAVRKACDPVIAAIAPQTTS